MTHVELVTDDTGRVRAECRACAFASPWATPGPGWDDARRRPADQVRAVVERVAATHLRRVAHR